MKTFDYQLGGDTVTIYYPESSEDLEQYRDFLAAGDSVLGFDTETTGLDIYSPGFGVRLAQFGNRDEAWVLRLDLFADVATDTLRQDRYFVAHNAPFDWLVTDRHLNVPLEELGPRTFDTHIFAHLLDPRPQHEGGTGLALKPLSSVYVDPEAPDTQTALYDVFHREYKATKATGWAVIDIDHPLYILYAGLDAILARRVFDALKDLVKGAGLSHLSTFEHHLSILLAKMQRKGILVDVDYTRELSAMLRGQAAEFEAVAARYGVANINATTQVADGLLGMGEVLDEKTPTGAWKVDKNVLAALADLDRDWEPIGSREPNPLADAVLRAKRAGKWDKSYAGAFLELKDADDRLHPSIGALQARTARMSISRPPLQQLPSSDWMVRRAMIADPGHLIVAADFDQIELRVLAALANEPAMIQAIKDGVDLHDLTATLIVGEGFTRRDRQIFKSVGFGKVYGGGAKVLARQAGISVVQAKSAMSGYDKAFPGIRRYGRKLQVQAQFGEREVITETGRHLPLDRDRLYAATNYSVQSLSRDLFAQAIVDIHAAGLGDYLLLPVHDELVAQAPAEDAEEVARLIGQAMTREFKGVPITASGEVFGSSWGHGYGIPVDSKYY